MHIELAAKDEAFIKECVREGYYRSESEAVRDAVRRAREQYEARRDRLNAALARGQADLDAGRVVEYTEDFMEKSLARAKQMLAEDKAYDPDVIP